MDTLRQLVLEGSNQDDRNLVLNGIQEMKLMGRKYYARQDPARDLEELFRIMTRILIYQLKILQSSWLQQQTL